MRRSRSARGATSMRGNRSARRLGRALWPVLATLVFVVVLFTAVFPTRTFLTQRAATETAERRLEVLTDQSAALEERAAELDDDEVIERLAREQYNLVMPGEDAYAMLPPPAPPTVPAEAEEAPEDRNVLERIWHGITGVF